MKLIGKTIGPEEGVGGRQPIADDAEETPDGRQAERLRVGQVRVGHVVVPVTEEADIVELDLVEALVRQVTGDGGDVFGHARVERVEPDAATEVVPGPAGGRVANRQLRAGTRRSCCPS